MSLIIKVMIACICSLLVYRLYRMLTGSGGVVEGLETNDDVSSSSSDSSSSQPTMDESGTSIETTTSEFQAYDSNDALILSQQNAGNIIVLKGQMDDMLGVNQEVKNLRGDVTNLQQQVTDLVMAQNDYANSLTGGVEPEITGTTEDEDENEDGNGDGNGEDA